jgi:hypothetical protein
MIGGERMVSKKEPIGYKTQAAQIQESYEGIADLLATKRANWSMLADKCQAESEKQMELANAMTKSKQPHLEPLSAVTQAASFHITIWVVAQLGQEITEVHQRLTSCEKAIKELKLALKG